MVVYQRLTLATDAELLAHFSARRAQLEQLMETAGAELERESLFPATNESPTLRILARYAKVTRIVQVDSEVRLYVDAVSLPLTALYKGYAFSRQPLTPLVDSLDAATEFEMAYRPIDGPWYLFREREN